ncbi:MAG: 4-(cytidine 5'-diphospho)-2-C-methyl-D-erythritol kinase [Thermotaleaceae bacterium]
MSEIRRKARAKINISLDVLGKRADGYHEVKMLMQQVDLYDEVILREIKKGIVLESNCEFIPKDGSNIAYKAAALMQQKFQRDKGIHIYIGKNIPVAAGLAGGSTDGAAVLLGLKELWEIDITREELMDLSLPLGADVPFCILGGAALAEGIGEKLRPIQGLEHGWVLLCKPNLCVSTAEVYKNLQLDKIERHPDTNTLLRAMENNDIQLVGENLCNVLEGVTEPMHPVIKDIKRRMMEYSALGSLMSGSGPTVYGLFKDYQKAKNAYENLNKVYKQTYLVKTYNRGNES